MGLGFIEFTWIPNDPHRPGVVFHSVASSVLVYGSSDFLLVGLSRYRSVLVKPK